MKMYKRCGWLALALLAVVACFVLQVMGSVAGLMIYAFAGFFKLFSLLEGMDDAAIEAAVDGIMMDAATEGIGLCLVLAHSLMIVCFALWYRLGCGKPKLKEAKGVFAPKTLLVVLLVAGGMCFFTNFALPVMEPIIPEKIMQNYIELMEQAGFGVDALAIFASVCLAPFGEEFLCRGVIFHYGKKMVADLENRKLAFWIANTLQALMFGIIHGNIIQGSYAFLMGLALGYLAHRFHSIVPAIMGHMLINATSTFVWEPVALALPESYTVYAIGAVISLAVAFAGLYLGGPAEKKEDHYEA